MTASVTLINTSTDTFQTVVDRINQLANLASNSMVTATSAANGSVTTGNAYGNGIFAYATLVAGNLRGGNVQSTNTLTIVSNVVVATGNNISVGNSTVNVVITEATVDNGLTHLTATMAYVGNSTVNTQIVQTGLVVGTSTVNATHTDSDFAIFGNTTITANALVASSNTGYGVYGFSNTNYGVYGITTTGSAGVFGGSTGNTIVGVYGLSNTEAGVHGQSNSSHGLRGTSNTSFGVYGLSTTGSGVVSNNGMVVQNGDVDFGNSVTAMELPGGTTAQRPSAGNGKMRYNTTESIVEMYVGGTWDNVITTATQLKVYDSSNSQVFP